MKLLIKPQKYKGRKLYVTDSWFTIEDTYGDFSFRFEYSDYERSGKNLIKYAKENYYQYLM